MFFDELSRTFDEELRPTAFKKLKFSDAIFSVNNSRQKWIRTVEDKERKNILILHVIFIHEYSVS